MYFYYFCFFFFNDTATTEIYTLSLHDALPIFAVAVQREAGDTALGERAQCAAHAVLLRVDRKSTRLNSSHLVISYAVFCLKKKKKETEQHTHSTRQTQWTHRSCANASRHGTRT